MRGSDRIGKERHAGRFDLDGSSAPHRILSGVLSVFERLRKMSFPGCRQVFVRGEKSTRTVSPGGTVFNSSSVRPLLEEARQGGA